MLVPRRVCLWFFEKKGQQGIKQIELKKMNFKAQGEIYPWSQGICYFLDLRLGHGHTYCANKKSTQLTPKQINMDLSWANPYQKEDKSTLQTTSKLLLCWTTLWFWGFWRSLFIAPHFKKENTSSLATIVTPPMTHRVVFYQSVFRSTSRWVTQFLEPQ